MRQIYGYGFMNILLSILLLGNQYNVLSEENENEIKKVVEYFVLVKDIEDEIIFGYPIEELRLVGSLKEGRNIPYIVDFFENNYEEEVLDQYLYYLKRNTSQRYHKEMGIFWGSNYKVIGNVAKREANSIEYEIDYKSIEVKDDITVVNIEVTPIYFGDYNNRGRQFTEYRAEKKEMELKLRKDIHGKYKLVELSEENLANMETEIGKEINLEQNEELLFSNPNMDLMEFQSESQKQGYIFAYDLIQRFSQGGINKVYDRYNQLFCICLEVTQERIDNIVSKEIPVENLLEGFKGWDYGYILSEEDVSYEIGGSVLLFNVENKEVTRLSVLPYYFSEEELRIEIAQQKLNKFIPALNQELNLYLGTEAKEGVTLKQVEDYAEKYMIGGFEGIPREDKGGAEPWSFGAWILPQIIDNSRRINTGRIGAWLYDPQTKEYSLSLPDGKQIVEPFSNVKAIRINDERKNSYDDEFYWTLSMDIESHYFYSSINLYQYDIDKIRIVYISNNRIKGKWLLDVDWGIYLLWDLYQ